MCEICNWFYFMVGSWWFYQQHQNLVLQKWWPTVTTVVSVVWLQFDSKSDCVRKHTAPVLAVCAADTISLRDNVKEIKECSTTGGSVLVYRSISAAATLQFCHTWMVNGVWYSSTICLVCEIKTSSPDSSKDASDFTSSHFVFKKFKCFEKSNSNIKCIEHKILPDTISSVSIPWLVRTH